MYFLFLSNLYTFAQLVVYFSEKFDFQSSLLFYSNFYIIGNYCDRFSANVVSLKWLVLF